MVAQRVRWRLARGFGPDAAPSRKPRPFQVLARTVWTAPEGGRASSIALRAARKAAVNPYALREILAAFAFSAVGDVFSGRLHSVAPRPTPSPVVAFLLEPAENTVPRVIAYLDAPELPLPAPGNGIHDRLAEWLVHAAMAEGDTRPGEDSGPLCDLLARTDQPDVLDALHSAFSHGIHDAAYYATRPDDARRPRPYRLWTGTSPAPLTRVVSANPHLLRLPPPDGEPPRYVQAPQVLLALLQGRPDLVGLIMRVRGPHGVVKSLRDGLSIAAPPEFTQECRRALRRLEDPAARDDVCRSALYGDEEMRAAAVDAGYVPSDLDEFREAAFLFATGQWERYDAADPDGGLLTAFCTERRFTRTRWWDAFQTGIRTTASGSGRADPFPPPPRTPPPSKRRDGAGSWPDRKSVV